MKEKVRTYKNMTAQLLPVGTATQAFSVPKRKTFDIPDSEVTAEIRQMLKDGILRDETKRLEEKKAKVKKEKKVVEQDMLSPKGEQEEGEIKDEKGEGKGDDSLTNSPESVEMVSEDVTYPENDTGKKKGKKKWKKASSRK